MFLDTITRRNPALIDAAISLHQSGELPANTYAFDLEAVHANARTIAAEARRLGLTPYAMLKQVGRNPDFTRAVVAGGIEASVAVDMQDARATHRAGMRLGHVGHLVQVPRAEAAAAASMAPEHWTVFGEHKAHEAASAAAGVGREQRLLRTGLCRARPVLQRPRGRFPGRGHPHGRGAAERLAVGVLRRHHHLPGDAVRQGPADRPPDQKPADAAGGC